MKRLLIILLAAIATAGAYAADDYDCIILNNGTVLNGHVVTDQTKQTVTITTTSGNVYTYPLVEVNKITYSGTVATPKTDGSSTYHDYPTYQTGFWGAIEATGGYSCRLGGRNIPMTEIDISGGYRFNEFLRVGVGIGSRYYINSDKLRYSSKDWAFPIYANIRGNFIPTEYRNVVPYYSFDIGGVVHDGFMIRPTLGIRVGQERSAFLLGISYIGQNIRSYDNVVSDQGITKTRKNRFTSFVALRVGYEF